MYTTEPEGSSPTNNQRTVAEGESTHAQLYVNEKAQIGKPLLEGSMITEGMLISAKKTAEAGRRQILSRH